MERADVLIVGGGPAGSACAERLAAAGREVVVVDAATFPRDKPCAGWITPEVLDELPFPLDAYGRDHDVQPLTRFLVGRIGGGAVEVDYGRTVSYSIRRRELDAALVRASGARVVEGTRVREIVRRDRAWLVDGRWTAPVLVGAGGHFCPVARTLGGAGDDRAVVVAREAEFLLSDAAAARSPVAEDRAELWFCRDFRGYGWCLRKGAWLNVGLGRLDPAGLPAHLDGFLAFLRREGRLGEVPEDAWRGHAYRIRAGRGRILAGEGFALVGDAAGLAESTSGEGILPARVSGRLAAETILEGRLETYPERLSTRLGPPGTIRRAPRILASTVLRSEFLARRMVLDRGFLHLRGAPQGQAVPRGFPSESTPQLPVQGPLDRTR